MRVSCGQDVLVPVISCLLICYHVTPTDSFFTQKRASSGTGGGSGDSIFQRFFGSRQPPAQSEPAYEPPPPEPTYRQPPEPPRYPTHPEPPTYPTHPEPPTYPTHPEPPTYPTHPEPPTYRAPPEQPSYRQPSFRPPPAQSPLSSLFNRFFGGAPKPEIPSRKDAPPYREDSGYSPNNVGMVTDAVKAAIIQVIREHEDRKNYVYRPNDETKKAHPLALKLQLPGEFGVSVYKVACNIFKVCDKSVIKEIMREITLPNGLRCPDTDEQMVCSPESVYYRTYDGSCNNQRFPSWGKSFTQLNRLMPNDYADRVSEPRRSLDKFSLPSARLVSTRLSGTDTAPHPAFNHLLVIFGQFLDHDLSFTPTEGESEGDVPQCCYLNNIESVSRACFPIAVPYDDQVYSPIGQTCLEFVRSIAGPGLGCLPSAREQINQITAYLDGSNVYGSTEEHAEELRTHQGGYLVVTPHPFDPSLKALLKRNSDCCESCECAGDLYDFDAGDERVNEQHTLTSMHTLFARFHNDVCDELFAIHHDWDDERLYQTARRIVGALLQVITYKEFLPVLLGPTTMNSYELSVLDEGYTTYDENQNAGIFNEFSTVAYRIGHTLVKDSLDRITARNENYPIRLVDTFFRTAEINYPHRPNLMHGIDPLVRGLMFSSAETFDTNVAESLRNNLFHPTCFDVDCKRGGSDLVARNIQRARDHGVPGYTKLRELCFGSNIRSFSDLRAEGVFDANYVAKLSALYKYVGDIDPFPGIIAERSLPDGVIGETAACIIGMQFQSLKYGDRFYFEHTESKFTPGQLQDLRRMSLASVICQTSDDVTHVPGVNIFGLTDQTNNPLVDCNNTPKLDFTKYN